MLAGGGLHERPARAPPGRVKENTEPPPSRPSTQISPPWRSTILRQIARPIPVPSNASRSCRRWNILNTRSRWRGSIPMPSSATVTRHIASCSRSASIHTHALGPERNFSALATRFCSSWASESRSPSTVGIGPTLICARASATAAASEESTSAITWPRSIGRGSAPRPARE